VDEPVSTLDILPSILALAGTEPPANVAGLPLPGLSSDVERDGRLFFSETQWHHAVVTNGYYYTKDKPGLDEPEPNPITGGEIVPGPPRLFTVGTGGIALQGDAAAPGSEIAAMTEALDEFSKHRVDIPDGEIPEEMRRVLEALGYSR
jgi:hypothetical protein